MNNSGSNMVLLALSKDDLDRLVLAVALSDQLGIDQLAASGRYFQVPNGTAVHVIDTSTVTGATPVRQVRVLAGSHVSEAGWVLATVLVP